VRAQGPIPLVRRSPLESSLEGTAKTAIKSDDRKGLENLLYYAEFGISSITALGRR
jgi:hypothetical protein